MRWYLHPLATYWAIESFSKTFWVAAVSDLQKVLKTDFCPRTRGKSPFCLGQKSGILFIGEISQNLKKILNPELLYGVFSCNFSKNSSRNVYKNFILWDGLLPRSKFFIFLEIHKIRDKKKILNLILIQNFSIGISLTVSAKIHTEMYTKISC